LVQDLLELELSKNNYRYKNVVYYIPDRHKEGYGMNEKAILKLKEENVGLMITIDLGITNVKEIELANGLGVVGVWLWWCVCMRVGKLTRWRGWVCAVGRARAT
jgi:hypothetical protein